MGPRTGEPTVGRSSEAMASISAGQLRADGTGARAGLSHPPPGLNPTTRMATFPRGPGARMMRAEIRQVEFDVEAPDGTRYWPRVIGETDGHVWHGYVEFTAIGAGEV